ncbi:MAG: FeoB-associated Cys-rich membrane protein [Leptonema sp. (in: Bacteria)]|nr:FeoB-associated Cys-rich membrane protein [Leptonema sp. (in: bacteria)]
MSIDLLIIGSIVLFAVLYLARRAYKSFNSFQKKEGGHCAHCDIGEKIS